MAAALCLHLLVHEVVGCVWVIGMLHGESGYSHVKLLEPQAIGAVADLPDAYLNRDSDEVHFSYSEAYFRRDRVVTVDVPPLRMWPCPGLGSDSGVGDGMAVKSGRWLAWGNIRLETSPRGSKRVRWLAISPAAAAGRVGEAANPGPTAEGVAAELAAVRGMQVVTRVLGEVGVGLLARRIDDDQTESGTTDEEEVRRQLSTPPLVRADQRMVLTRAVAAVFQEAGADDASASEVCSVSECSGSCTSVDGSASSVSSGVALPSASDRTAMTRRTKARDRFKVLVSNTTGWSKMKEVLSSTDAQLVLGAETWVTRDEVEREGDWCKRAGWKALFSPALPTSGRFRSAGVMVAVRSYIGAGFADEAIADHGGRLLAVHVDSFSKGGMVWYPVYLHTREGLTERNEAILRSIAEHATAHGRPWAAGGDWNMGPEELAASPLLLQMRAVVVSSGKPTCYGGENQDAKEEYDYFIVDARIAHLFIDLHVDEDALTRPHRPVSATVCGRMHTYTGIYVVHPRPFPPERPMGPVRPPPAWGDLEEQCDRLAANPDAVDRGALGSELGRLWHDWCGRAEMELAGMYDIVGHEAERYYGRGGPARLARKPCLGWKGHLKFSTTTPKGRLWRWLEVRLLEVGNLTVKLRSGGLDDSAWFRCAAHRRGVLRRVGTKLTAAERLLIGVEWADRLAALSDCDVSEAVPSLLHLAALESVMVWAAEAAQLAQVEERLARNRRLASWRDFVRSSTQGSARMGHRLLKGPKLWQPEGVRVVDDDGAMMVSYSAEDVGNMCMKSAMNDWGVGDDPEPPPQLIDDVDLMAMMREARENPLAGVDVTTMRAACSSFCVHTALGLDGWHPRLWAWLCDDGCSCLLALLRAIEMALMWPADVRQIVFARIPKEAGGHRLIGLLTSLYRVWAKLRRPLCQKWEDGYCRGWDYASKGAGAVSAAWDLMVEWEASEAVGMKTAAFMGDLKRFYEFIPHTLVLAKARRLQFPPTLAILAVHMYGGARRISVDKCLTGPAWTLRGVVAGCSLATTVVKLILLEAIDSVVREFPRLRPFVYLDDITLLWRGTRVDQARTLVAAIRRLVAILEGELHAKVSRSKTVIVASAKELARVIKDGIGDLAFQFEDEARLLGVDLCLHGSGGSVRAGRPVRRRRMGLMRRRMARLAGIKRAGGDAGKLWATGSLPAATVDSAVLGAPPGQLLELRRRAGAACLPGGGGRSLTIGFLIHRRRHADPVFTAGIAPVQEWAKQVWCRVDSPRVGSLKLAFKHAMRRMAGLKDYWRAVYGPGTATIASLWRLGWTMDSAFVVRSDVGVSYDMRVYSPLRLRRRLHEACERWQCRNSSSIDLAALGDLDWDNLRFLLHGRRSPLSAEERGALRSLVDGSAWDAVRCWQAGYVDSPSCRSCGAAWGNHHHEIWCCSNWAAHRSTALPHGVVDVGKAAPVDDPHWVRCLPNPRVRSEATEVYRGHRWIAEQTMVTGDVYVDGSSIDRRWRWLQSAGLAVVMLDEVPAGSDGDDSRYTALGFYAPIDGEDHQPGDAETQALLEAVCMAEPPLRIFSDCAAVVTAFSRGVSWSTSWRRLQADRWKRIHSVIKDWGAGALQVVKVKAHRSREVLNELDGDDKRHWWGNWHADLWAKRAAGILRADVTVRNLATRNRVVHVQLARWAASVVSRNAREYPWSRDGRRWDPIRVLPERVASAVRRHELIEEGASVRCVVCNQWAVTPTSQRRLRSLPCRGTMQSRLELVDEAGGVPHLLMRSLPISCVNTVPVFWCAVCGAYAESAARNLTRACPRRATRAGKVVIRRLIDGWHPRKHVKYYGGDEVHARGLGADSDGEGAQQRQQESDDGGMSAGALPNPTEAWASVAGWGYDDPEGCGQSEGSDPEPPVPAALPAATILQDDVAQQQRQQQQRQQLEWWENVWGRDGVG